MTSFKYENYPPKATAEETSILVVGVARHAKEVEFLIKAPLEPPDFSPASIPAPITLYPSLYPRTGFENALRLQPAFNLLYANIANDLSFLEESISR
jgi:hypothetical protein